MAWKFAKLSTVEGEAAALFDAIRMASTKVFDRVVFESDSQILVNAIYSNHQGSYGFSAIVSSTVAFMVTFKL